MVAEKELSILQILNKLKTNYVENTPKRIKLIDMFIIYLGVTALVLFGYVAAVGTFPFNAFLAAFFTSICLLVLTVSLRKHVHPDTTKDFVDTSTEKAYGGYVVCSIVLFFVATIFMG
eukprot:gene3847-7007_t